MHMHFWYLGWSQFRILKFLPFCLSNLTFFYCCNKGTELQTRKVAVLCRVIRVGRCFSKRVLTSLCIVTPQYLQDTQNASGHGPGQLASKDPAWAKGWTKWHLQVPSNPDHFLFLWISNCMSHLPYSFPILCFCEDGYCLKRPLSDSVHKSIPSYYLMSQWILLQINSKLLGLN